jgi:hypothetical protein
LRNFHFEIGLVVVPLETERYFDLTLFACCCLDGLEQVLGCTFFIAAEYHGLEVLLIHGLWVLVVDGLNAFAILCFALLLWHGVDREVASQLEFRNLQAKLAHEELHYVIDLCVDFHCRKRI